MRLPLFTIRTLLGVILFIALVLAAFRASTDTWDSGVLGMDLLLLLTATLLAIHRTDGKRAYWLGFALFGWVYLVLSLVPSVSRGSQRPGGSPTCIQSCQSKRRPQSFCIACSSREIQISPVNRSRWSPI